MRDGGPRGFQQHHGRVHGQLRRVSRRAHGDVCVFVCVYVYVCVLRGCGLCVCASGASGYAAFSLPVFVGGVRLDACVGTMTRFDLCHKYILYLYLTHAGTQRPPHPRGVLDRPRAGCELVFRV